jgi:ABC-type nickel/cobalt efflux system permease component RcnA
MKYLTAITAVLALLAFSIRRAEAHPMGNFSINHYSGIVVGEKEIRVRYILDLAEIPAFQEIQEIDTDRDKTVSPSEQEAYLDQKAQSLASGLVLKVAGEEKRLRPVSREMSFPPGVGGLPTLKVTILYAAEAPVQIQASDVFYRDDNYPNRAGWKEMAAAADSGIALSGSVLPASGGELRSYSEEGIKSPPQVLETRFSYSSGPASERRVEPGNPVRTGFGKQDVSLGGRTLASLMDSASSGGPMVLFSLLIAFGLGTLHALSPGHGKTLVAAYLVGSRGTARHALLLGLVVTLSHTVGVFLLGLVVLYLSKFIVPDRLYPWLGLVSGLSIVAIGFSLFRLRWRSLILPGGTHRHDQDHSGHHHDHHHDHGHDESHDNIRGAQVACPVGRSPRDLNLLAKLACPSRSLRELEDHDHHAAHSLRGLLGLGITGGMIPCPSALVVLLSAVAFHQLGFGLLLIVAFSAGMAMTLVGIGFLMVYLRGVMGRFEGRGSASPAWTHWGRVVPVISSGAVAMLGAVIAIGSVL